MSVVPGRSRSVLTLVLAARLARRSQTVGELRLCHSRNVPRLDARNLAAADVAVRRTVAAGRAVVRDSGMLSIVVVPLDMGSAWERKAAG